MAVILMLFFAIVAGAKFAVVDNAAVADSVVVCQPRTSIERKLI